MSCDAISTNSGIKIYIAPAANMPATLNKAGWEAVTGWVEIGTPLNISARGIRRAMIELKPLDGTVCKMVGSPNNGTLSFRVADLPADSGQLDMLTAVAANLPRPFKIVHDDATATLDKPSVEYLTGVVAVAEMMDAGDADSIRERMYEVGINEYLFVPRYDSTP